MHAPKDTWRTEIVLRSRCAQLEPARKIANTVGSLLQRLPTASFASGSKKAPGHRSPDAFHRGSAQPAVADRPYPSTQQRLRRAIVPGFTNRLCTRGDVT